MLFPSIGAPAGTKSGAKASALRPAKDRPSVANLRHLYSNRGCRICADGQPWCLGDHRQLSETHSGATGGFPRLAGRPPARQPCLTPPWSVHLAGAQDYRPSARSRLGRNRPSDAPDIESPVQEEPTLQPRFGDQMKVGVNADELEPSSVRHGRFDKGLRSGEAGRDYAEEERGAALSRGRGRGLYAVAGGTTGLACRSPLVGDPRRGVRCSCAIPARGPRPARPALVGRATRGMDDPTDVGWSKPQLSPQNGSPSSAKSL